MALVGREETHCRGSPGEAGGSCPGQQILLLKSQSVQDSISIISRGLFTPYLVDLGPEVE